MIDKAIKATTAYVGFNLLHREVLLGFSKTCSAEVEEPIGSVSIIMPVYNEEKYIEQSLSSIFKNNIIMKYPDSFEVIVIDNGSTDRTPDIVAEKYPGVKLIYEDRRGVLYAKDTGTRYASGNIIVWTNADVFYPCNWLNNLLKPFKDENVVAVSGIVFDGGPGIFLMPTSAFFIRMPFLPGGNAAVKKEVYIKEPFNLDIDQLSMKEVSKEEERNFAQRISKYGKVVKEWTAGVVASSRRWFKFDTDYNRELMTSQRMAECIKLGG